MVAAKVRVDFKEHWAVVDQEIRRDGNRIILQAKAEPLAVPAIFPPPPPPSEDLLYEIGPLREGAYIAVFMMNGHVYDAEEFEVERSPEPPIPAAVELEIDASNPEAHYLLGESYFDLASPKTAERAFAASIEIATGEEKWLDDAYYQLGHVAKMNKNRSTALKAWTTFLERNRLSSNRSKSVQREVLRLKAR